MLVQRSQLPDTARPAAACRLPAGLPAQPLPARSVPPLQVQVLVEVRSGRWQEKRQFELLECSPDTGIAELKARALAAAAATADAEAAPDRWQLAQREAPQELTFLGQTCLDGRQLRDYGVNQDFIQQVAGFVLRPAAAAEARAAA